MRSMFAAFLVMTSVASAMGQGAEAPGGAATELVTPPALRRVQPARAAAPHPTRPHGKAAAARPAPISDAGRGPAVPEGGRRTVDYGLSFHAADDPHYYTQTAPDGHEIGSGVTAGVRFGF